MHFPLHWCYLIPSLPLEPYASFGSPDFSINTDQGNVLVLALDMGSVLYDPRLIAMLSDMLRQLQDSLNIALYRALCPWSVSRVCSIQHEDAERSGIPFSRVASCYCGQAPGC